MPSKQAKAKNSRTKPKTPSEFAPGVFVGNWEDAQGFEGAKFCVLDRAPDDMPPATHVQIYDEGTDRADPASLDLLAEAMRAARAQSQPVLVFCHQGVFRSPLGAAWYLHRAQGLRLDEAYQRIKAVRPKAKPASSWVGNYAELEREGSSV